MFLTIIFGLLIISFGIFLNNRRKVIKFSKNFPSAPKNLFIGNLLEFTHNVRDSAGICLIIFFCKTYFKKHFPKIRFVFHINGIP